MNSYDRQNWCIRIPCIGIIIHLFIYKQNALNASNVQKIYPVGIYAHPFWHSKIGYRGPITPSVYPIYKYENKNVY
jgi:hypothetical protein